MQQTIQKHAIKKIINLATNTSDEKLIKIMNIGEKIIINKDTTKQAREIKQLFLDKHPATQLVKNTLNKIS